MVQKKILQHLYPPKMKMKKTRHFRLVINNLENANIFRTFYRV